MKCPNCNATLVMADRSGVEIDYCPECRGVWLDRGELDKIIERSAQYTPPAAKGYDKPYKDDYRHKEDYHKDEQYYKKKKRDSFLGDLFDF
jgi:Zn-finger nucleic acid-binding protein